MTTNISLNKRDVAERDIVAVLEAAGATVSRLSGEAGLPDLLVGFRGNNYLLEVKTGKRKLRTGQREWRDKWQVGAVAVVHDADEALAAIGG